jgi:hypothetical protein
MNYVITKIALEGIIAQADIRDVMRDGHGIPKVFPSIEAAKAQLLSMGWDVEDYEKKGIKIEPKKYYGKREFQNARRFIAGAEIVKQYSDPCVSNTTYVNADGTWFEHWSKLEAPEDDYYLKFMEPSNGKEE